MKKHLEIIDVIKDWTEMFEGFMAYCVGNAINDILQYRFGEETDCLDKAKKELIYLKENFSDDYIYKGTVIWHIDKDLVLSEFYPEVEGLAKDKIDYVIDELYNFCRVAARTNISHIIFAIDKLEEAKWKI